MNEEQKQAYLKIRREHPFVPAFAARCWTKDELEQKILTPIEWEEPKYQGGFHSPIRLANLEREGFHIHLELFYDYDHDWTMGRGNFKDRWEEGAIENPRWYMDKAGTIRYFVPDTSVEDHRKEYQKMGYSASSAEELARSHVLEDCKIAADPDGAGYIALGITATASLKGVELGSDGLWGTEVESIDEPDILQAAWGIIEEAIRCAKKNLAELKSA